MSATIAPAPGAVGLYGPETVTWRLNREAVLLAGGGRALLLQVAHPLVGAGVEQHSDYREDPWGRLFRTLDLTTKIVFGDPEASDKAARTLRGKHVNVQGTADDGTPYDARDPDLLLWVWATLVDTTLLVYQRCVKPIPVADIWTYYEEQKLFAHACGIPEGHCPETFRDFCEYCERMIDEELRVTDAARAVARTIIRPTGVPRPLLPVFAPNNLTTAGLLPERIRAEYGFEWSPGRERLLDAGTLAIRRLLPLLPTRLREFPAARLAARRIT
jgi:uncharacterized protein (DUF2236 family)